MSDLISRKAAIDIFNQKMKEMPPERYADYYKGLMAANEVVQGLPSAQPEIIRCKDCKYCEHWYADKGRCFLWHEGGIDVFEEGFCNYAERRGE